MILGAEPALTTGAFASPQSTFGDILRHPQLSAAQRPRIGTP